jgi:hypothetical protein
MCVVYVCIQVEMGFLSMLYFFPKIPGSSFSFFNNPLNNSFNSQQLRSKASSVSPIRSGIFFKLDASITTINAGITTASASITNINDAISQHTVPSGGSTS